MSNANDANDVNNVKVNRLVDNKKIIDKIKKLSEKEKCHILSILQKNNIEYTKNNNGYFFNLKNINDSILSKIDKCVDLIEKNRDLIYSLDVKRESYLNYYKNLIQNKLNESIKQNIENCKEKLILKEDVDFKQYIKIKKNKKISTEDPDVLIKQ